MDYDGFWYATAPYGADAETRAHCDQQIAAGANPDTVLDVTKHLFCRALTKELGLNRRQSAPWLKLVDTH